MMEPYIGEIKMFAGNFAPRGWAFCDGQLLSINENEALFSLIGTTYGGDGQSTFALPNLKGRVSVSQGTGGGATYTIGQTGGTEEVTLTLPQLPQHTHQVAAYSALDAGTNDPTNAVGANSGMNQYSTDARNQQMSGAAISSVGGNQPHNNMMPFVTISYIIALVGIYPSQN